MHVIRFAFVLVSALVLLVSPPAGVADEREAMLAENRADLLAENRADLEAYFADQVEKLAADSVIEISDTDAWPEQREKYRQQLAEMLGLHPMPEPTPLEATVTGTLEQDEFTVEKVHFQSLPGLYVTGNLYLPKDIDEPAPTILYLCGHASRVRDGVSLGNKTAYQHHPAWFARHGYVCLVVDTIQLGEIQGLHHGTHRQGMWWWNSRGYSPAGVEAFNAMRALDYLETRDEVDANRFGVTGRSGGGIGTLYLAALDERVAVAAPVAGITDIHNHVVDHLTPRHCDCNYFPNPYRFDYARIVSLIAPRPLLIANSDRDAIFPLDGVQRVHREVREVYRQLDAEEDLGLAITVGGHQDTQQLRVPVFSWFNRHLKGDDPLIRKPAEPYFDEAELRVFNELPDDEIVTSIHDTFVRAAEVEKPDSVQQWQEQRDKFRRQLREITFRNWPEELPSLTANKAFAVEREGVHLQAWDFTVEPHVELRLYLARMADAEEVDGVLLHVMDESGWKSFLTAARVAFGSELPDHPDVTADEEAFAAGIRYQQASNKIWATLAPRGIGDAAWAEPDSSDAVHLRRSFPIIGQTLDGQRVLDVQRAIEWLGEHPDTANLPITLRAKREMAGVALYAVALDESVAALEVEQPPPSHHEGPELLNVLRFMDLPQALALALEHTEIRLKTTAPEAWEYSRHVAELLDRSGSLNID